MSLPAYRAQKEILIKQKVMVKIVIASAVVSEFRLYFDMI